MKKRIFWMVLVLLAAGMVTRYVLHDKPVSRHESHERRETSDQPRSMTASSSISEDEMHSSFDKPQNMIVIDLGNKDVGADDAVMDSENEDVVVDDADATDVDANGEGVYIFQVDRSGQLVLNEKTRLAIERLYAMNTPEELKDKLQEFSSVLPSDAHREVINLLDDFEKYTMDLGSAPPYTPETVEDALAYLQELHDQREMHFGPDVAKALFEKEESTNREMLELIYKEKDFGM